MAVHIPAATQWTEISVAAHTCAITTDRALWCWGDNGFGELGSGAAGPSVTAPSAPLAGTWLHVEAESFNLGAQTCAIRSDRTMWCWGRDQYPALTGHMVPTQVGGDASWLSLSGAWQTAPTTCAIKLDGSLWCWGVRLGDGTTSSSVVPVRVGVDNDWQSVSVGNEVCAIKTSGTLWCWGNRDALGDGTPVRFVDPTVDTSTTAPTQIGHDTDWSTAAIGGASCAIKLDGSLWCWGTSVAPVPGIATTPVPVR
jgi:alpha-tubulin suppressor-like RCC1 family protein